MTGFDHIFSQWIEQMKGKERKERMHERVALGTLSLTLFLQPALGTGTKRSQGL